jgi:hypothetical protein
LTPIQTEVTNTREVFTANAIAELPPELLEQLQEAVIASNLKLIARVVQQIAIHNDPLSQAIETCLHNFEYEKVLHLIAEVKGGEEIEK